MMTRPIVVGTDFSKSAEAAVERATEIAKETRAPLHIVHASASLPRRLVSALLGGRDEHAERAALDAAVRRARERGVCAHGHLVPGAPTSALRTKARELSADLIVVGARGRVVPDTFVGATAERVAAFLRIAVLLVRRPVDHGYREVIIAAGKDVDVGRAVAASAIVAPRTDLSVLHAYGSPHEAALWLHGATEMSMLRYRRDARREARAALSRRMVEAGVDPERLVLRHGDPRRVLRQEERRRRDALLVIERGRSEIAHALLGSITRSMVAHGTSDILII